MQQTWILAADDVTARLFSQEGGGLKPVADFAAGDDAETEITNRTVGRSGSSPTEKHKYEPSMAQSRQEELAFAHRIAAAVNDAAAREAFGRLVLVATPQMLGYLRDCLDERAKMRLAAEVNKELAQLPDGQLQDRLLALLRDPDVMNSRH